MDNYTFIIFKLLGALGLLIYGMKVMSDALQKLAGPQLRHVLGKMTTNRFTGMLTGTFVTCAVQSSSATTVMTVSFVSAGLLTLSQAISVIMGANIGTTLTAWIMSLGYNVDLSNVVYLAFLVGMTLIYKKKHRFIGDLLFGIAFLFLALVMLSAAGKELDLEHNEDVMRFFSSFDTEHYSSILLFLLFGTIITCIVQSSAAVMAITIMLCSTGVLPIYLGIALVMGENIGTTATANIAALGANVNARRTALAHLLFNVIGVIWVLAVFYPFVDTICDIVGYRNDISGDQDSNVALLPVVIAMFHTSFNVINTAMLIGLIPYLERLVCVILPEKNNRKEEIFELKYIQGNLMKTPEIAIYEAQKETIRLAEYVQEMFGMTKEMIDKGKDKEVEKLFGKIEQMETETDKREMGIAKFLEKIGENHLSDRTKAKVRKMMREIGELESVGDACYNIARIMKRMKKEGITLKQKQNEQLKEIMRLTDDALSQMNIVMKGHAKEKSMAETYRIENEINETRTKLREENMRAINDKEYDYVTGTIFIDLINECEHLADYVVNVVQARLSK